MNRRLLTILLCAFVVAAGASYIVYRMVGAELTRRVQGKAQNVVTAVRDLDIGVVIKKEDLKIAEVFGEAPKGAVLKPETAIGRGVITKIYQGETVLDSRLALAGSGGGLAATIPPGMRACAVKVNEVVGVAGFVVPGMRVDVLVSGSPAGNNFNNNGVKVRTLLQNIEVLSAGTNFQQDAEGKPVQVTVVNVLVTPEQAELLSLASNESKIQLVLRNPLDRQLAKPPGTEFAALFGEPVPHVHPVAVVAKPAPVKVEKQEPPRPNVYTVQVINGDKHSDQTFSVSEVRQ
jgi:pilus assembly protein CpaB